MTGKPRIAVAEGLNSIKQALSERGYQVVDLGPDAQEVDAVVVTGLDTNMMGFSNTTTKGPVFEARGRQPEELIWDIEKHVNLKH